MPEEPVTIVDREVLKVLSVDTRMDIMKLLSDGDRTPSFVAKKLNKSDATIVEHLEKLERAGLVKRIEQPGKKWIFYTLTDRGIGIISSKSRRLVIILTTSLLALAGGFASLNRYFSPPQMLGAKEAVNAPSAGAISETVLNVYPNQLFLFVSVVLFTVAFVGLAFYLKQKSKRYEYG